MRDLRPPLSVVIVTFKSRATLGAALDALIRAAPLGTELVVVENGGDDDCDGFEPVVLNHLAGCHLPGRAPLESRPVAIAARCGGTRLSKIRARKQNRYSMIPVLVVIRCTVLGIPVRNPQNRARF